MLALSKNMQVITITHLPQVASLGNNHYHVEKEFKDDYSKNEELMRRGVAVLGLNEDLLTNIEVSIGTKTFMELGKRLGEAISEDTAKGLGGGATISEEITTQKFFDEIMSQGANFL